MIGDTKLDDEIKALIIDSLDNSVTGGGDLDGLMRLKDGFLIIEFLRCITVRPFDSHPNRYWDYTPEKVGNKNKFLALWKLAQKTSSRLILINYEDNREQFKIIEVKGLDERRKIFEEVITKMNFEEFKIWLRNLYFQ